MLKSAVACGLLRTQTPSRALTYASFTAFGLWEVDGDNDADDASCGVEECGVSTHEYGMFPPGH